MTDTPVVRGARGPAAVRAVSQPRDEREEDAVGTAEPCWHVRMDDAALGDALARARRGDHAAFGLVYRDVHPMLLGYLRGLIGDEADDVASETWHDIVRDLTTFRGDGQSFRGWARPSPGTGRWTSYAAANARGRAPRRSTSRSPSRRPRRRLRGHRAWTTSPPQRALALIAALPQDQAEAVLLRVMLGLSGPMAAKVLGNVRARCAPPPTGA